MPSQIQVVLLDIEGTTSSVSFIYDVMFPFVLRELDDFVARNWSDPQLLSVADQVARDDGADSFAAWCGTGLDDAERSRKFKDQIRSLMANDVKATGLKQLQGLIWKDGFERGELVGHVYDDVPPALERWHDSGKTIYIYSSGSIAAQKLFFGHNQAGNLLPFFAGHFDTTTGPKKETDSYRLIAQSIDIPADHILFISDVVAELDAARRAGMQTLLSVRPGNAPISGEHDHAAIESFDQVSLG